MIPCKADRDLLQVGFLAARWGHVEVALAILSPLVEAHPERGAPYVGLLLAHLARGQLREALDWADRGLRMTDESEHPDLHALRGVALAAAGRNAESVVALRRAGDHPLAHAFIGRADVMERSL